MKRFEKLKDVIFDLHGARATHRESVPITETWNGQTIWDGVVEVFDLHEHPHTDTAYAWSYQTDNGPDRHVAELHLPPALSPLIAVRSALVAEARANAY